MDWPIQSIINQYYNLHSRVHLLNCRFKDAKVYIKREDELSSGVSGSKYRKFASLIPFFLQNQFDEILLIGSAQSNNIVAGLQLLKENEIAFRLMLLQSNESELKGNLLWMHLLHDMKNTIWVPREEWDRVGEQAKDYQAQELAKGGRVFILPEGGAIAESLPGAITLASDIAHNETELGLTFDHIFIDSGSGTSAIGLVLGLEKLQKTPTVHITLIAGTKLDFLGQYKRLSGEFITSDSEINIPTNMDFYTPSLAASFGSVPQSVLQATIRIAQTEGIMMDPVYSVKHYQTAMETIERQALRGNILFIYNGGSLGLAGFQDKLKNILLG